MQTRTTYATKKVQFEQEVDQSNIAAQRAYSRTQRQLNNARSLAILENQEDFKKMLQNEGLIEAKAAERGVRGKSIARALVMNNANFGISQAMRSRGLTMAGYQAKESNENVNIQLKSLLNRSFGKVAIQPVADLAPPPPVMQNVGMTFMLGMGKALGAGIEGMPSNTNPFSDGGSASFGTGVSSYSPMTPPSFGSGAFANTPSFSGSVPDFSAPSNYQIFGAGF